MKKLAFSVGPPPPELRESKRGCGAKTTPALDVARKQHANLTSE